MSIKKSNKKKKIIQEKKLSKNNISVKTNNSSKNDIEDKKNNEIIPNIDIDKISLNNIKTFQTNDKENTVHAEDLKEPVVPDLHEKVTNRIIEDISIPAIMLFPNEHELSKNDKVNEYITKINELNEKSKEIVYNMTENYKTKIYELTDKNNELVKNMAELEKTIKNDNSIVLTCIGYATHIIILIIVVIILINHIRKMK